MQYKFIDLVDVPKLEKLMHSLYRASGIPSGVTDAAGNLLVKVGWQEICKDFHRQNPRTEKLCRESNARITVLNKSSGPYVCYRCPLGLIDAAAPVVIDGFHLATVFQGQFLFEAPDLAFFERQAESYGFDKARYLAALAKVPIYTPEKLDDIMHYFLDLGEIFAELGLARLKDIERQKTALLRSDEQIYRIFNSTPNIAIQGYDRQGNIIFWNDASEKMYGYRREEVCEQPLDKALFDAEGAALFLAIIDKINAADAPFGPNEWKVRHKNGGEVCVYSTIFPIRLSSGEKEFICMDVDLTERNRLADELKRFDRLNLIGEMAASLAHEIRNPMTTVRGYLQMLRRRQDLHRLIPQLDLMIAELDSANLIITEYLSLAKNKKIDRRELHLNQIVEILLPLLAADAVSENKRINWLPGNTPSLLLDAGEIRQLVVNLVRNALEAVEPGGTVRISTSAEDGEITLRVQDNGKGIPTNILDRIGTPFLTTKPDGNGLGLAVCFSIAARHNAKIAIKSSAAGTSVAVKFAANS